MSVHEEGYRTCSILKGKCTLAQDSLVLETWLSVDPSNLFKYGKIDVIFIMMTMMIMVVVM